MALGKRNVVDFPFELCLVFLFIHQIAIFCGCQVHVEKLYIESETVESGLVELISQHKIERLVMGAAADRNYARCVNINYGYINSATTIC